MTNADKKIFTVSLIGCGRIGFGYDYKQKVKYPLSHFSNFLNSEHFVLKAIAEPDVKTRKIIKEEFNLNTYSDYKELLKNETTDIVCIASPDATHETLLLDVLNYDPLLVFCEKPLSLNFDGVQNVVKLYERKKIPLMVNYSRRFIDEFQTLKRWIDSGELGKIQTVTIYYSRGFVHNATHYLDIILWYFGFPEKILVESQRKGLYDGDPTISFILMYESGIEIRFMGIDTSDLIINEMDIVGDNGRVKIDTDGFMSKYKVNTHPVYTDYKSFVLENTMQMQFNKVLNNAACNIFEYLAYQKPLLSPASNSIDIFRLSEKIKTTGWPN